MKDVLILVQEDWQKIPASVRYIFYAGVSLILIAWLGDHWSDQQQYHVPIFASNEGAFQTGFGIIAAFFVLLFFKQIWVYQKIQRLRFKYPINQLGQSLHLINFNENWIFLLDQNRKQLLHVKTPQTMNDIWFYPEWYDVGVSKDAAPDTEFFLRNGTQIKLRDYRLIPGGIFTR